MSDPPCILVVEDEKDVLAVLVDLIETDGYRVLGTTESTKALDMVRAEEVDLVLVDLMMPERDGWHLLDDIKKYDTAIPVIVLTGFLNEQSDAILASTKADSYLIKPVDHDRLQAQIRHHLMPRQAPDELQIFVIDADAAHREDTVHALGRRGFRITAFDSPDIARPAVLKSPPSLIILEVCFPGSNGFDFCRQLQEDPDTRNIPLLILTSDSSRKNLMAAIQLGVRGFIAKPAAPNDLVARVARICRHQRET